MEAEEKKAETLRCITNEVAELLDGMTPGEQVDALEDLAADLQVRADELREAMRRPPEEGS
jgi:hypothetical protein